MVARVRLIVAAVSMCAALFGAGVLLTVVPRSIFNAISAPTSGANRKPTALELERAADSARERKRERDLAGGTE